MGEAMKLGEAIQTAIDYETKVLNIYRNASDALSDTVGKRLFQVLADDEQYHVDYLKKKLDQWQKTGQLTVEDLKSSNPDIEAITGDIGKLESRMSEEDRGDEKQMLSKALTVEVETSNYYKKMVSEMSEEGQQLFSQFMVIEDGHIAAVQAELDFINSSGYWFDSKEFDME
jgi:rubrerythrin